MKRNKTKFSRRRLKLADLPGIRRLLLGFLLFGFIFSAHSQQRDTIDYAKRELKAPIAVKNMLVELRKEKISKGWTFDVGYTWASDKDIAILTGGRVPANFRQFVIDRNIKAEIELKKLKKPHTPSIECVAGEKSFDWRKKHGVTPIKNQENCGSCWDFAAHSAFEASWLINNKESINSSEQSTLDCISGPWYGGDDCGGGWASDACDFMQQRGSASTFDYSYDAHRGTCLNTPFPYKLYTWGYVGDDDDIPSIAKIKEALCRYGPLAADVYAGTAFKHYVGGVFNERSSNGTDHVVTIIGWDDTKEAWLIKNSWGTDWGSTCDFGSERGYMWINYHSNSIGHGAIWVLAQENEEKVHGDTIRYRIPEPIVNRPMCVYDGENTSPKILFEAGDKVSITAGGCAQTGGWGSTWKRYVDPEGSSSDQYYYCEVQVPGVTNGVVPLRKTGGKYEVGQPDRYTINFTKEVPANLPESERYLKIGYTDDNYSDNGYYSHDNGNNDQCKNCGNAYFILTIVRKKP